MVLHRTTTTAAGLVAMGILLHAASTWVWSALYTWLVLRQGWRVPIAAAIVAIAAHLVGWIAAWQSGNGVASLIPLGDRLVFAVTFAVALIVGIRIAFSATRSA